MDFFYIATTQEKIKRYRSFNYNAKDKETTQLLNEMLTVLGDHYEDQKYNSDYGEIERLNIMTDKSWYNLAKSILDTERNKADSEYDSELAHYLFYYMNLPEDLRKYFFLRRGKKIPKEDIEKKFDIEKLLVEEFFIVENENIPIQTFILELSKVQAQLVKDLELTNYEVILIQRVNPDF